MRKVKIVIVGDSSGCVTLDMRKVKIVIVGDRFWPLAYGIGKTGLIIGCYCGAFPGEYIPRRCDTQEFQKILDSRPVSMTIEDTDYEDLDQRKEAYKDADIVVIGYSIVDPQTLQSAQSRWIEEVRQFAPQNPIVVLSGLKMDLRTTESGSDPNLVVSRTAAEQVRAAIGAVALVECSGLTQENARQTFEVGVRALLEQSNKSSRGAKCLLS